ncbi:MAG: dihydrodipicolinate synthase family protein, partial [Candidatus Puniceispirillum sp.]
MLTFGPYWRWLPGSNGAFIVADNLYPQESIIMIKGLIAPILTPFDDNLNLDQARYNELAKHLLNNGLSGLAPFGTTGEALSVSNAERKAALKGLVAAGIDPGVTITDNVDSPQDLNA